MVCAALEEAIPSVWRWLRRLVRRKLDMQRWVSGWDLLGVPGCGTCETERGTRHQL